MRARFYVEGAATRLEGALYFLWCMGFDQDIQGEFACGAQQVLELSWLEHGHDQQDSAGASLARFQQLVAIKYKVFAQQGNPQAKFGDIAQISQGTPEVFFIGEH